MIDISLVAFLGFVVFFAAAFIGKKNGLERIQNEQQRFNRECSEEREKIVQEKIKAEQEISNKKASVDRELFIRKHSLEQAYKDERDKLLEEQYYAENELSHKSMALAEKQKDLVRREEVLQKTTSNLSAIPYMAGIIADYDTRGLDILAASLDWGANVARQKKVVSIREIRNEAKEAIASSKVAEYQLAYAIQMFPALEDFLDTEYGQLPELALSDMSSESHDAAKDYLSKEEYMQLSSTERNQLALDRYRQSHRKTKLQIGRDYELYVGYKYTQKGYSVDYFGSYKGLEDLGRDLIAKKDDQTLIIQCKYWGTGKLIHENHINQLYGTMVCYCYENNLPQDNVQAVLVTNITVSETARNFAQYLGVEIIENFATGDYPCIKCNINRDESGNVSKIYHLPFDQQYNTCKIDAPGEFLAMTVAEAEAAGFRRAYRWHADNSQE